MKKFEWKVNVKECSLSEINRELKRLASLKCRAKSEEEKKFFEKKYNELVGIKNKRFGGKVVKKCNYMGLNKKEIESLSVEDLEKGLNVIYSMRCYYKGSEKSAEVEKMFEIYKKVLNDKKELIKFEELKKKFT